MNTPYYSTKRYINKLLQQGEKKRDEILARVGLDNPITPLDLAHMLDNADHKERFTRLLNRLNAEKSLMTQ
jgi:hypothetical protein